MSKRGRPVLSSPGAFFPGTGHTDKKLLTRQLELDEHRRGGRGLLFDNEEFAQLASHLVGLSECDLNEARARLNWLRGFYLKALGTRERIPKRADRNETVETLIDYLAAFLCAFEAVTPLPEWDRAESRQCLNVWRSHAFTDLPRNLCLLSTVAGRAPGWRDASGKAVGVSEMAERAAHALRYLDSLSQGEIMSRLPWLSDYSSDTVVDLVAMVRRVKEAAESVLADSKAQRGRESFPERVQTVAWLADLCERYGVRFTHCATANLIYDGAPQSQSGRFVLAFFRIVDPALSPSTVSGVIKEVVAMRRRCPQTTSAGA